MTSCYILIVQGPLPFLHYPTPLPFKDNWAHELRNLQITVFLLLALQNSGNLEKLALFKVSDFPETVFLVLNNTSLILLCEQCIRNEVKCCTAVACWI